MISETIHHLLIAADALHGAAAMLAGLLAWAMALAFGADGPGPAPALVTLAAVAWVPDLSAPVPSRRLATAETIRRDELVFVETFQALAAGLRSGEAEAHQLEDLRDFVPLMLGYARQRGADSTELASLHARYWGTVGVVTRVIKRRR